MKTEIIKTAIKRRYQLRFIYDLAEVMIEPYYIAKKHDGQKVIYGRVLQTNQIKKFDLLHITNVKIMHDKRFSPIIPIIPMAS